VQVDAAALELELVDLALAVVFTFSRGALNVVDCCVGLALQQVHNGLPLGEVHEADQGGWGPWLAQWQRVRSCANGQLRGTTHRQCRSAQRLEEPVQVLG
jgi:hypothetical protein